MVGCYDGGGRSTVVAVMVGVDFDGGAMVVVVWQVVVDVLRWW